MKSLYLFYCSLLLLEIGLSTFTRTSPTSVLSQSLQSNSSRPPVFTSIAHSSANSTTGTGAHKITNGTSLRRRLRGSILRNETWTTQQIASVTNPVTAAASPWFSSILSSSAGAKGEPRSITAPTIALVQAHTGSSGYLALANSSSWMSVEPTPRVNRGSSTLVRNAISASTLANTSLTASQNELRDQLSAVLPLVQTWINNTSDNNRNNALHAINGTILLAEVLSLPGLIKHQTADHIIVDS